MKRNHILLGLCCLIAVISTTAGAATDRSLTVLAINDVYRIAGVSGGARGGLARVRTLRRELEQSHGKLLVLLAGDILFPSLLSRTYQGEQMIDVLNQLDGSDQFDPYLFVTFGNHEFDKSKKKHAAMLKQRVTESQFTWVNANVRFSKAGDGKGFLAIGNHVPSTLVELDGMRVGIFGLTTDTKIPEYVRAILDPIEVAREMTAALRKQGANLVIALTHLNMARDRKILEQLGPQGPDVIFGGHEHFRQQAVVAGRRVIKADADAVTATVAHITPRHGGPPKVEFSYRPLGPDVQPNVQVQASVDSWLKKHARDFCRAEFDLPPGCLDEVIGQTGVTLTGEELQMRSIETNLGSWAADQALAAFSDSGAQIAFINSGGLRLNYDIPSGEIKRRHIVELFAYPSPLHLIEIDGATLMQALDHAISGWPGIGHWLQIAGFGYQFDSHKGKVGKLLLIEKGKAIRPIGRTEKLKAVVNRYLLDSAGDQDGFKMLNLDQVLDKSRAPDLKDLVIQGIQQAGKAGIAPRREGRICNLLEKGPCIRL